MDNLLIEIGADTQEFLSGLAEVGDSTGSLGDKLGTIGATAATAFAAYTAAILGTVYAYREEELAGQEVLATIQATGGIAGVTSDMVDELAESFSKSTTFSKLQVEQGEAMLLTFDEIGSETFPAATQATLDLAQHMGGDAAGAAKLLGKALQDPMTGTTALTRAGVMLTAQQKAQIQAMELAGNIAGAQAIVIQAVEDKYGGMAQAAAGGTGQIIVLKNMMEEFAAQIGAEFAPAIGLAAKGLADFIGWMSENPEIVEFTAAALGAAAAVTGVATVVIGGVLAFSKLTAVMEASGTAMQVLGILCEGLAGATGIGLVLLATYELYEHWNQIWPAMQAVYKAFVDNIGNAAQGLWKILNGAFTLDLTQIKAGLAEAAAAFASGGKTVANSFAKEMTPSEALMQDVAAEWADFGNETQMAENRARLTAARAGDQALRTYQAQELQAQGQLRLDTAQHFSTATLALEKQMIADLKSLADAKYQGDKVALAAALKDTQAQYAAAYAAETTARAKLNNDYLKNDKAFQSLSKAEQKQYLASHEAQLVGSMQNETTAKEAVATADVQRQIALDNTLLQDQVRFGTAYAEINYAMHNVILTQSETSLNQLQSLTQSKGETLKEIGKVASAANIAIKTAEGALAAYAGFCQIPIVGPALGIAAAGAVVAYGVEQEAKVFAAAEGGLMTGGIPGVDSIPTLTQQGELVVPEKSFEEVVNSVAGNRAGGPGSAGATVPTINVVVSFKGSASKMLTVQINQDKALGRYQGIS